MNEWMNECLTTPLQSLELGWHLVYGVKWHTATSIQMIQQSSLVS